MLGPLVIKQRMVLFFAPRLTSSLREDLPALRPDLLPAVDRIRKHRQSLYPNPLRAIPLWLIENSASAVVRNERSKAAFTKLQQRSEIKETYEDPT